MRRLARATVATLLYSGLRISDVAALRRDAVDFSTGYLTTRVIKTGVPIKIRLHSAAVTALASLPMNPEYPDHFFLTGRLDACIATLSAIIRRLGKMTGIHAHAHRFRDTFSVSLLDLGEDIRVVQKLLGHKSIRTTEMHYAHHSKAQQLILDAASTKLNFESHTARPVLVQQPKQRA